jgi:hypothetical protein
MFLKDRKEKHKKEEENINMNVVCLRTSHFKFKHETNKSNHLLKTPSRLYRVQETQYYAVFYTSSNILIGSIFENWTNKTNEVHEINYWITKIYIL